MNKKWAFTGAAVTLQLVLHFTIQLFYTGSLSQFFLICLLGIALVGSGILFLKAKEDQFVGRFMIATTVQMLSALSIIAAIVYLKVQDSFKQALLFIFCFIGHLVLQSVYLVRQSKNGAN